MYVIWVYSIMVNTSEVKSILCNIGAKLQYKMNGVMPWSTIQWLFTGLEVRSGREVPTCNMSQCPSVTGELERDIDFQSKMWP